MKSAECEVTPALASMLIQSKACRQIVGTALLGRPFTRLCAVGFPFHGGQFRQQLMAGQRFPLHGRW